MRKVALLLGVMLLAGCAAGHPVYTMSYDIIEERIADVEKFSNMVNVATTTEYDKAEDALDPAIVLGFKDVQDNRVTLVEVAERLAKASAKRREIQKNRTLMRDAYEANKRNIRMIRQVARDGRSLSVYLSKVSEQWKGYMMSFKPDGAIE